MEVEDRENEREIQANQRDWHVENYNVDTPTENKGAEDMEIMSAGNVTFNYGDSPKSKTAAKTAAKSKVLPVALAALLVGSGLTFAALRFWPRDQVVDTDNVNRYDVGFGEPEYKQESE